MSIGEINHSQTKKHIIRFQLNKGLRKPIVSNRLTRIKGGAKKQNKIDAKLKIVKDPLSKIFLLLFF